VDDEPAAFEEDDPAWALDDPCPNPQCPETDGMWVTYADRGYDTIRCGGCGEPYPG